jgi:hypothetical protein
LFLSKWVVTLRHRDHFGQSNLARQEPTLSHAQLSFEHLYRIQLLQHLKDLLNSTDILTNLIMDVCQRCMLL